MRLLDEKEENEGDDDVDEDYDESSMEDRLLNKLVPYSDRDENDDTDKFHPVELSMMRDVIQTGKILLVKSM